MKNFIYKKLPTLEEVCSLLSQDPAKTKILAGGTELLVKMKSKLLEPEIIIDLKGISGLDEIGYDQNEGLTIGPLATFQSLETSKIIQEKFGVISETAGQFGSTQIRNLATLGGHLCNASPASDMAPCLISLGATIEIMGSEGKRWVPLEEFFTGPGKTVLKKGEILTSVQVPNIPEKTGCVYMKHSLRKAMDMAIVGVATAITLDKGKERIEEIKIVLGAVSPIPMRAQKAEDRLRGKRIDKVSIEEASRLASEEARPITDLHGSAEYRKEMVRVITKKSIRQAMDDIL